jgi:hypothetical protein
MRAMRALWIVAVLAACHPAEAPVAAAPKRPTACARAADNMVAAMLAGQPASDAPTEAADGLRNLIRERCERDGWSAAATQCLIGIHQLSDAEPCAQLMTEDQQAALVRDGNAQFSRPAGAAGSDGQRPETKQ